MMSDLNKIIEAINEMRSSHNWTETDTINVLVKSIVVEANELLQAHLNDSNDIKAIKDELADVLMYAFSLADDLNIDIEKIINDKIKEVNTRNYEQ